MVSRGAGGPSKGVGSSRTSSSRSDERDVLRRNGRIKTQFFPSFKCQCFRNCSDYLAYRTFKLPWKLKPSVPGSILPSRRRERLPTTTTSFYSAVRRCTETFFDRTSTQRNTWQKTSRNYSVQVNHKERKIKRDFS